MTKLKPNIRLESWSQEEDEALLSFYHQFGKRWCQIASLLPGRTDSQVKNRFYTTIKQKHPELFYKDAGDKANVTINSPLMENDIVKLEISVQDYSSPQYSSVSNSVKEEFVKFEV